MEDNPLFEKLKGYKALPSLPGMAWAQNNWHDSKAVADRITLLAKERKLQTGKGKATVCAVLGAALIAAQRERQGDKETIESLQEQIRNSQSRDKETIESLQEQVRNLQSQLAAERNHTQRLQTILSDSLDRERILRSELEENRRGCDDSELGFSNLAKLDGKQASDLKSIYPIKELEESRNLFYPGDGNVVMRPLIKTETIDNGQGGIQQHTTRIIPYSPQDLAKIQEKYSRGSRETETEYVWRVSLTGGDRILLSEDEARGYWGPRVFLTTNDNREPWSLTQRVAYWAGGLDPMERGDPFSIKTPTAGHILESVQKTACLQLMHDRLLLPQQPSPMQCVADPERSHPLIRGLPDAVQLQDRLRTPRPRRRGGPPDMTWGEVAQELINYGRRMGFTGQGETKHKAEIRRVEESGRQYKSLQHPHPGKPVRVLDSRRQLLWAEGISKGIPREVMDRLPTPNLEGLVRSWDRIRGTPSSSNPKVPPPLSQDPVCTPGLLKRTLRPHNPGWARRISDAVTKVNGRWGVNGCPRLAAFCPNPPSLLPGTGENKKPRNPLYYPGQPVLVDLPTVGQIPLVLKASKNLYAWVATDAHGKDHRIHARWILPSF